MTSPMVERVAMAIWKVWARPDLAWEDIPEPSRDLGRRLAAAAIATLRDPNEAMLRAAANSRLTHSAVILPLWRVMIDAALAEPDPDP